MSKGFPAGLPWLRRALLESLFLIISFLVLTLTLGKWRAWKRNSLALGYWSRHSDLDITIYSASDASVPFVLRWLRGMSSGLGEWAAYTAADRAWASLANPLELARDPILVKRLAHRPRQAEMPEAFVFWLRLMKGDVHLKSESEAQLSSRRRKWAFHLHTMETCTGIRAGSPFPYFLEEIAEKLSPIARRQWQANEALLWPHQWLPGALERKVQIADLFRNQPAPLLEIAREQVRWEIWGLLGQVRLNRNLPEVTRHLENLSVLFPSDDPIQESVEAFIAYLRSSFLS